MTSSTLIQKKCTPCEKGTPPLSEERITTYLGTLSGWKKTGDKITKTVTFKNYYETISFVNATAWISNQEDHHPDLMVTYNTCTITLWTHTVGGLSENDFICAAKIDALC